MLFIQKHTRVLLLLVLAFFCLVTYSNLASMGAQERSYNNTFHAQAIDLVLASVKPRNEVKVTADATTIARWEKANDCGGNTSFLAYARAIDVQLGRLSSQSQAGNALLSGLYALDFESFMREKAAQKIVGNQLCRALRDLTKYQLAQFESLAWREHAPETRVDDFGARWVMLRAGAGKDAVPTWAKKYNPWGDLPGCTYLGGSGEKLGFFAKLGSQELCAGAPKSDSTTATPFDADGAPSDWLSVQWALSQFAKSTTDERAPGNRIKVLGRDVAQAPHMITTLNGSLQLFVQRLARCMTAGGGQLLEQAERDRDCRQLGLSLPPQYASFYEGAATRMIGIAVLNVASGEIEAIGSSHTRCYRQEHDGPGRDADCPALPTSPRWRPYMLENHALRSTAFPGSLVKPVTAVAMMLDDPYKRRIMAREAAEFRLDLARSRSAVFHQRLFCGEKGFQNCDRPANLLLAAKMFGWSRQCEDGECESLSLVDGAAAKREDDTALYLRVPAGRLGLEATPAQDGTGLTWRAPKSSFAAEWALECSRSSWEHCRGGSDSATELLAEAWGQGNAQVSPVGVAAAYARLAQAANGEARIGMPHLLKAQIGGGKVTPKVEDVTIPADMARLIVSGLALGHSEGTSRSACSAVFGGANACQRIGFLAGKTGTPTFNHDTLSIQRRAVLCAANEQAISSRRTSNLAVAPSQLRTKAQCDVLPYKWYAGLIKSADTRRWDKVVVVLSERNWNKSTGLVDSPGDLGLNISAWAAMQVFKAVANGSTKS